METAALFISIFTIAITVFITLYFLVGNRKIKDKKPPPESAGGWPLIGHLPLLSGPEPLHIVFSNMADKHGPIYTVRLGTRLGVVVNSWEIAKECLATHDLVFMNRPKTAAVQHMSYNYAMYGFSEYGPYWRDLRKLSVVKLLSNHRVTLLGDLFEQKIHALMRSLYGICSDKVEMKKVFGDLTLNLMVKIVAGEVGNDQRIVEGDKWRVAIREFFRMMDVLTVPDVLPFLKWWEFIGRTTQMFKKTSEEMDGVLQAWLDEHKKRREINSNGESVKNESFMEEMMKEVDQDFLGYDADTVNKATCQVLMLGGTSTISATLTWALSLLLNHPHTITRAQQELDAHVGRHRQVHASDLPNLVYVHAIIKETLRLNPPTPVFPPRETIADCMIAGYHIPAGTRLMINGWKIHRDPRIWSNPQEFQPERFLTDHKGLDVRGLQFEYIPFGSGRRVCPGITFAMQVTEFAIASLLHGFDIEAVSDEALDMTGSFGSTNVKATPLEVMLKPRLASTLYA